MTGSWQVHIFEQQQLAYTAEWTGDLELGRQNNGEGKPYSSTSRGGHRRIILARIDEDGVSRKHVLLKPLPDGRVVITNQSKSRPIHFADGSELAPRNSQNVTPPVTFHIGSRMIVIEPTDTDLGGLLGLPEPSLRPGASRVDPSLFQTVARSSGAADEPLIRWFQAAMGVLQSAASSRDFFDRATGALVDLVGLDAGRVMLREREQWRVQALKTTQQVASQDWPPSRQVLNKILDEKTTYWQVPPPVGSLDRVKAVVAAPILNRHGDVIGALYGDRLLEGAGSRTGAGPITRLQATLVELLAGGVAAGLARLEQEEAALEGKRKLVQMERELEIGREIQAGFLPDELPQVTGWEVGAYFRPARVVSGDFYDVFGLPHNHLALVIADVCDKGVGAALYMTLVRSLLRAFSQQASRAVDRSAPSAELTVRTAVEMTNNYVARTHAKASMFATLFFGVLDTGSGQLTYINAGHDAPVAIGSGGPKARLSGTGPVVGISPNANYQIRGIALDPGDTLLMYTDGVTEARDSAGGFFTEKRLLSLLDNPAGSVSELLDRVVRSVSEFVARAEQSDDVTILGMRRAA